MSVVSGGPFTPAKDAKREAAPPELFKLQIHRGDIVAKHVLGAGEFGEVYLATQNAKSKKTGKPVEVYVVFVCAPACSRVCACACAFARARVCVCVCVCV